MPSRSKPEPEPPIVGRLHTLRVKAGGGANYTVLAPGPGGEVVRTLAYAPRGAEVEVDAIEALRLLGLGAVCPKGWTVEDLDRDGQARRSAYVAARKALPVGA